MVFSSKYENSKPPEEFEDSLSKFYWKQLDKFAQKVLFVDYKSKREWTGAKIKAEARKIARFLIDEFGLRRCDNCVFFNPNSDYTHLVALGVLFAGGSVCVGALEDPAPEHAHMIEQMKPALVFTESSIYRELLELRRETQVNFKICIMNDDDDRHRKQIEGRPPLGLHRNILSYEASEESQATLKLPIRVGPDDAAYVLLTSGSTGQPKPVARSHRNSIYVCHSLNESNKDLWDLNEKSVFAGHLPLDHGTGTFSVKMTLAKGMKLIIMENYQLELLLAAIQEYKISDCILGSALLHNLMSEEESLLRKFDLSSMRNFISVGSPIPSHALAVSFMDKFKDLSVRQSLGMTECGFTSFVRRSDSRLDAQTVGWLLPNLMAKLIDRESGAEILKRETLGELYLGGPTVSPGYIGAQYNEQSRLSFMADGFYRTRDACLISAEGELIIRGRCNDVLCLGDGWKVLPAEIERALMKHPGILEAAVVGIPHPTLKSCHAPRAYVVPRRDWLSKLSEEDVSEFARKHLSEPKHLVGGVRLMQTLPRISIGKVDKCLLRKLDGF